MSQELGKRFNEGKTRYDLIPAFAQEQYARGLTMGANKYGDRNWEKGLPWSGIIASLERHLYAIKRGEDYDAESGLLHGAHIMCNAAFLTEYYKIYPQGDDRLLTNPVKYRIGMDIDGVLADFMSAYCERFNTTKPNFWEFDPNLDEHFEELLTDKDFWLNLKPIISPRDLPFEPVVYITARPAELIPLTQEWLFRNGFPIVPIVSSNDKLDACREYKVDRFIDDKISTVVKLNFNGVFCYLFDSTQNRYYDIGHRRITRETIKQIIC